MMNRATDEVIDISELANGYFHLACLQRKVTQQIYKADDYRFRSHMAGAAQLEEAGIGWLEISGIVEQLANDVAA